MARQCVVMYVRYECASRPTLGSVTCSAHPRSKTASLSAAHLL